LENFGVVSGSAVIVGLITEVLERPQREQDPRRLGTAQMDLVGDQSNGAAFFSAASPNIR
jgi:hypothetical protein